jgi:2-dehydro-3-deoxygluconokinase
VTTHRMKKLVTFGESLFRFSVGDGVRLRDAKNLDFFVGGTELNIAANYISLGGEASWVSVLPETADGDLIFEQVKALGVDLASVKRAKGNAGYYFLEQGSAPRADFVPVRQKSLFLDNVSGLFTWENIFDGAGFFHSSGVTAGLGLQARAEIKLAAAAAKKSGALFSYDCNYRSNLWSLLDATREQQSILPLVDILFGAESDLSQFFGVAKEGIAEFSKRFKFLVLSDRDQSTYGVTVWSQGKSFVSKRIPFVSLDRIGVGDSMAAGFFAAIDEGPQKAADFAAAAGALKYSVRGDMALLKRPDVELVLTGTGGIIR